MSEARGKLGVAVVGLGVGAAHARAYLATDRCELRWLYDLDLSRAKRISTELGAGAPAAAFEQILDDDRVHAVSIASFDDAHFAQVLNAINAGKHVFVEKPLCRTLDELQAIMRAWRKHGGRLKLSSNLVLRSAPLYGWLKKRIDGGDFGSIYAYDGDYLYGRFEKITGGWRKDVNEYSVILGGGIHLIDLMLWYTNQRPASVSAMGNRISSEGSEFRYDDYVAANFQFPSSLVGRITANFGCVHRHQHVVRAFGTKRTFIYDDAGARVHETRDPKTAGQPVLLPALPSTKGELIRPFVSAIERDEDLSQHTQQLFDAISVCVASDESLQTGSIQNIQYV